MLVFIPESKNMPPVSRTMPTTPSTRYLPVRLMSCPVTTLEKTTVSIIGVIALPLLVALPPCTAWIKSGM